MKSQVIEITPQLAKTMLGNNDGNRPLRENHVRMIANEIKGGRWMMNCQPILISADGFVLDGQHRLSAIILSGIAVMCLVIYGVDESVFSTLDNGQARAPSDCLAVSGIKNYTAVAALLLFIKKYEKTSLYVHGRFTQSEALEIFKSHPEAADVVQEYVRYGKGLLPAGAMYGIAYYNRHTPIKVHEFLKVASTGITNDPASPAAKLASRMIQNKSSKSKLSTATVTALCIIAWNYYVKGVNPTFIRYSESQPYPELLTFGSKK